MLQLTRSGALTNNKSDGAEETGRTSDGAEKTDILTDGTEETGGTSDAVREIDELLDTAEETDAIGRFADCVEGQHLLNGRGRRNDMVHESRKSMRTNVAAGILY